MRGVRFTENTAEIRIGDGLWVGASRSSHDLQDLCGRSGQQPVAFYGVMKELDKPLIIALRLKVIAARSRVRTRPGAQLGLTGCKI